MTQEANHGLKYALLLALLLVGCLLLSPLFLLLVSEGGCGGPSLGPVTPPPPGELSAGQMVRWFQSQGDSANASAGIVGNLEQESQLNPAESGGGLAQWNRARYGQMVVYAASVGLTPASDQGQLAYLQYDLRTSYSGLLSRMDTAPDPGTAAAMFETTYELCQGVAGYMQVIPGSLCEDGNRRLYAVMALAESGGGSPTTVPVSLAVVGGGGCAEAAALGSGRDPIPSPPWMQGRDDMGVDASARVESPIYAPAASTLVEVVPWFRGPCGMQPLLLFRFAQQQAGTEDGDQYWYVAEQITPVTSTIGATFAQGQPVARFAACGTGIELGWGSPTSDQRTLAAQMGDPSAAHAAPGSLTPWAESFKRWCQMPARWIGASP